MLSFTIVAIILKFQYDVFFLNLENLKPISFLTESPLYQNLYSFFIFHYK